MYKPHRFLAFALIQLAAIELTACRSPAHRADPNSAVPALMQPATAGSTAELVLLETTDLHNHVLSYDYDRLEVDPTVGFERVATLIRHARAEFPNTLLFDAGDTIQGTALSDYKALVDPIRCGESQTMFRAMDRMGYDAAALGNHEFNYGLEHLRRATGAPLNVEGVDTARCEGGPSFPLVLSNLLSQRDGKPMFAPFVILERTLSARDPEGRGVELPIRIAVLGFAPPGIMQWDKRHLEGRARTTGILEAAQRQLPEIMRLKPDLVLALSHGGLDARAYSNTMENANWHLAALPEIDALLLGHSHAAFPDPGNARSNYADMPEVDAERGLVRGKPAVMASFWGKSLGVMQLSLRHDGVRWRVDAGRSRSALRPIAPRDGEPVAVDPSIAPLVSKEHQATLAHLALPIGSSDFAMESHLVAIGDSSALLAVNAAQREYVEDAIRRDHPELADVPVLSAAASFKSGFGGPADYTQVPAGALTIRHAADLYLYPNSVAAILLDGTALKSWLERSAERFNRIDPARKDAQPLLAPKFVSYNFDVIQGELEYMIDVSKPVGERIVSLTHRSRAVAARDRFIVATNNHRATSRAFGGDDGSRVLFTAPDGNREVLVAYLRRHPQIRRQDFHDAGNWQFAPIATRGPITFDAPPGQVERARAAGVPGVREVSPLGHGLVRYAIDLAATP